MSTVGSAHEPSTDTLARMHAKYIRLHCCWALQDDGWHLATPAACVLVAELLVTWVPHHFWMTQDSQDALMGWELHLN